MRVVEVDPGVADLVVLDFHDRATVIAGLASGGRNVGQWSEVGSPRAPADDHMAVASAKDLLDIEMQIGKRSHINLEELARAVVSGERRREGVRFPHGLRVQPFDEGFHIVCIPRSEHLPSDMEVVLSSHGVLLVLDRLNWELGTPPPRAPTSTSSPSRGTSSSRW